VDERQHYTLTLAVLVLAGTAFAFQQTMVFPALPEFQRELGGTTAWVTWVLTAFLVSAAVTTPVLGKLGDQFGKERMLVISLSIFLAGSIGAAFAWNLGSLIGFRALAGAGGALFPLSFAIIRDEFPPERVQVGIGILSAVFGVGGGFGIVLSGVIVDHLSWRLLFVIGSIPVALALLLVHRYVPESPIRTPSRVDLPGAFLLSAALIALMIGLTEGESWGWTSTGVLGVFAASLALFAAWAVVELHVAEPMVDLEMLMHRPVLLTNVTTLISGFALFSCFVLVPAFVAAPEDRGYGFGASATVAGLYLLPSSIAMLFSGPLTGVVGRRVGPKWPLFAGMVIVAFAATVLAAANDDPLNIIVASAALGFGVGAAFAALVSLIAANVDAREMGVATGMNTVIRLIGSVIGGQLSATLLTALTLPGSSQPAEEAFTWAFGLAAIAALIAAAIALSIARSPVPRGALAEA
jgi:EmrB/QacA subfamily drug resistance transporter